MFKPINVLLLYDNAEVVPTFQALVSGSQRIHLEMRPVETSALFPATDLIVLSLENYTSYTDALTKNLQHFRNTPALLLFEHYHENLSTLFEAGIEDCLILDQLTPAFLEYAIYAAYRLHSSTNGLRRQKRQYLDFVKTGEGLHHQHKAQLRERDAVLDLIMAQIPAIIWVTDPDLVITSVTGSTQELLGIEYGELIGASVPHYFSTKEHGEVPAAVIAHRAALRGISGSYPYMPGTRMFEARVQPLEGNDGQIIGVIGIAVDVTERDHTLALLQQKTKDIERLYEGSQLLGSSLELHTVLNRVYQLIWNSIGCDQIRICLYDEESGRIRTVDPRLEQEYRSPSQFPLVAPNSADEIIQSLVVQTGRSLLIPDYQRLSRDTSEGSTSNQSPQSALVVPIKQDNKVRGVIQILNYQPDAYTKNDLRFAEALVLPVAAGIQNAILYEQGQRELTERKAIQVRLEESEQFTRAILNALTSHIAVLDEHGVIIETNQAWREFGQQNGLTYPADCIGVNYLDACTWSPDENAKSALLAKTLILSVLRGSREQLSLEYPCHSQDEQRWFLMRVTRFSGDGPGRVVVAHDNITARKNMELALENATEQVMTINRALSLASVSLKIELILAGICKEFAALLNMDAAVAVLMNDTETEGKVIATYPEKINDSMVSGTTITLKEDELYKQLLTTKNPVVIPDLAANSISHRLPELMSGRSLIAVPLMAHQRVIGAICLTSQQPQTFSMMQVELIAGIMNAISQALENSLLHQTVSKQNSQLAEIVEQRTAQLNRANERMAAILDSTSDAIVLMKPDGSIENTNRAFDRLFQREPDELYGQPISVLAEPTYREAMLTLFEAASTGTEPQRLEIASRRKDGKLLDVDAALSPMTYLESSGKPMLVGSFRDISHLKEVERLKDRFVSTVSHELRTPLTSLLLGSNSLRQHYDRITDKQRVEIINRVYDQANVLAALVEDILHLSQLEARRNQTPLSPVNLAEVLQQVVRELEMRLQEKKLVLELTINEEEAVIPGFNTDLVRIWRNLIDNAIKYTPDGGSIFVRLGKMCASADEYTLTGMPEGGVILPDHIPDGCYWLGQVEDTGRGITQDDQEQLFTRFFRGQAAHSNISGTGLGLALVKELLVRYGGDIGVSSQVGMGTSFTFWLPMRERQ